jgi:hypothetical protein
MTTKQIVEKLQDKRGQSLNVRLVSNVDCLAAHRSNLVQKVTLMTVVSGVSFENRKDIREAIEAGERGEIQPLAWGEWIQFPFVISHKGQDYIRLYLPSQAQQAAGFGKTTVQFICNGQPITRNEAILLCGSKAQARENESGCMTVKADNLAIVE